MDDGCAPTGTSMNVVDFGGGKGRTDCDDHEKEKVGMILRSGKIFARPETPHRETALNLRKEGKSQEIYIYCANADHVDVYNMKRLHL